jgi:hypothetical protein
MLITVHGKNQETDDVLPNSHLPIIMMAIVDVTACRAVASQIENYVIFQWNVFLCNKAESLESLA